MHLFRTEGCGVTPSASDFGIWILVAIGLLPAVKTLVDWVRPKPAARIEQPISIQSVEPIVTRADCERQHASSDRYFAMRFDALEARFSEMAGAFERRNTQGEDRAAGIHKRIDVVMSAVSEVRGKLENHVLEHNS
jgi:hypothetical protein